MLWWIAAIPAGLAALAGICGYENNCIQTTRLEISDSRIPKDFDGFKLLQVSDLHNKSFGRRQQRLIRRMGEERADVIVITGDLVHDSADTNAMELARRAAELAPVYYVPGNHEKKCSCYTAFCNKLTSLGIKVLGNSGTVLRRGEGEIYLSGMEDPSFLSETYVEETLPERREQVKRRLAELSQAAEGRFSVLLSHRPELFGLYAEAGFGLVFSGHAHGGQFRLPFVGGLFAPNQGIFPKYTSGLYERDGCRMAVSRGLGNSSFPLRLFNRPNLVAVTLRGK